MRAQLYRTSMCVRGELSTAQKQEVIVALENLRDYRADQGEDDNAGFLHNVICALREGGDVTIEVMNGTRQAT